MKRPLRDIERIFVKEANEGGFTILYEDDGTPYALGATHTSNCFSMDVVEKPDGDDSATYHLEP